eukprot:8220144-Alexandrium_andersonii.AAC.1
MGSPLPGHAAANAIAIASPAGSAAAWLGARSRVGRRRARSARAPKRGGLAAAVAIKGRPEGVVRTVLRAAEDARRALAVLPDRSIPPRSLSLSCSSPVASSHGNSGGGSASSGHQQRRRGGSRARCRAG